MLNSFLYLILFLVSFSFFINIYSKKQPFNVFSPYFLFPLVFFIYSFAGLLFYYDNYSDIFGNNIGSNIGFYYLITCLIGLLGFYLGFYFVLFYKIKFRILPSVSQNNFKYLILFYCLISLLINFDGIMSQFNLFDVKSYGEVAFDSRIDLRNNKELALIEILFQTTPIYLFLYYCFETFKKSKTIFKYFYVFPAIILVLHSFLSGTRAAFISYGLFIYFYFYFNNINLKSVSYLKGVLYFFIALSVYSIINIIPIVRSASNFSQMFSLFETFYDQNGLTFLKLQNSSELQTSVNLQKLQHEIINNNQNLTYGINMVNDLLAFIPRIFFNNRPLPTSELFAYNFYNEIYSQGGGMGMFVLIDGYWSFGNFGVLITSFLFSIFIAIIYNSIYNSLKSNSTSIFIFIAFFQSFIISSVRGGMILSIRSFFLSTFIFYMIAFVSKKTSFKSNE